MEEKNTKYLPYIVNNVSCKKNDSADNVKVSVLTNEELAAISIALFKYSQSLRDEENNILTINRTAKVYSPWSSKIHSLTQTPNKKNKI